MNYSSALVTGGAGFIGSHLVELLLNRGISVRVLDIRVTPTVDERAEFVRGSILDRQTLSSCMEGIDCVFHLAADPNLWAVNKNSFFEINYNGTRVVLEEAEKVGVQRIVYTSTESILKGMRGSESEGLANEETVRGYAWSVLSLKIPRGKGGKRCSSPWSSGRDRQSNASSWAGRF